MWVVDEDTRAEAEAMLAARRNGLVECPQCGVMVDVELLGITCEVCGAEGCEQCIVPGEDRTWSCVDSCDCTEGDV